MLRKTISALALGLVALGVTACKDPVPAGFVGVQVNLYGDDRGVQTKTLGPGRYWMGINEQLFLFPTFETNYEFTQDVRPSSPRDEALRFQSRDGMNLNVDLSLRYIIDPAKAPVLFQRFRRGIDEITRGPIYNTIRDNLVRETSNMTVEEIYGPGKASLIERVEQRVSEELAPLGIKIEAISFISEVRVPEVIRAAINQKLQANQLTLQRENEVAQTRAEAQKRIEESRGLAESQLLRARAEADSIRLRSEALRSNPELLQLEAIQRWNGQLPTYMMGNQSVPFINVPNLQNTQTTESRPVISPPQAR